LTALLRYGAQATQGVSDTAAQDGGAQEEELRAVQVSRPMPENGQVIEGVYVGSVEVENAPKNTLGVVCSPIEEGALTGKVQPVEVIFGLWNRFTHGSLQ